MLLLNCFILVNIMEKFYNYLMYHLNRKNKKLFLELHLLTKQLLIWQVHHSKQIHEN